MYRWIRELLVARWQVDHGIEQEATEETEKIMRPPLCYLCFLLFEKPIPMLQRRRDHCIHCSTRLPA